MCESDRNARSAAIGVRKRDDDQCVKARPGAGAVIPWAKQTDLVPRASDDEYRLRAGIGVTSNWDYYNLGVVFAIEASNDGADWQTIFRKTLHRRDRGWCDVDLAFDRLPMHSFHYRSVLTPHGQQHADLAMGVWRQPTIVSENKVVYDFAAQILEGATVRAAGR